MSVIDADAHVVETERTWEYMEEAESPFKPEVVVPKAGGDREYWLIEGRLSPRTRTSARIRRMRPGRYPTSPPGWSIWTSSESTCIFCIRRSS